MIEPQTLIKAAKRCNYELGLRINKTKQVLLDVDKGRVRLPDDFYTFNYGLLCNQQTVTSALPQGLHIEHSDVVPAYKSLPESVSTCTDGSACPSCQCITNDCGCPISTPCDGLVYNPDIPYGDDCVKPRVFVNCKGDCVEIIQKIRTETRVYNQIIPLRIVNNGANIDGECPNLYMQAKDEIWIKDNFLWTSFDCGTVFLNYQGDMEDEEGNLLVPDHDLLNEFYEYALKEKILENLMFNDENVVNKLSYIQPKLKAARNNAMSLVNTPDFAEMRKVHQMNRQAQYKKYYRQFQAYNWFTGRLE